MPHVLLVAGGVCLNIKFLSQKYFDVDIIIEQMQLFHKFETGRLDRIFYVIDQSFEKTTPYQHISTVQRAT